MPQLDNFLAAVMVQRQVQRAVLLNDRQSHLFVQGQDTPGPIIPGAQLQAVLSEILPPDLKSGLQQGKLVQFPYQSPVGLFNIGVQLTDGALQVEIITQTAANARVGAVLPEEAAVATSVLSPPTLVMDGGPLPAPPPAAAVEPAAPASEAAVAAGEVPEGGVQVREYKRIQHIDEMLRMLKVRDASDLHISSKEHPYIREQGIMVKLDEYEVNEHEYLKKLLFEIAPKRNQIQWENEKDTDFSHDIEGVARYRCNLYCDRHGIGGSFRLIPSEVLTVDQLKLPKAMTELCFLSKGLVVVTGPTGSGKSTTLAALVDHVNKSRTDHIITIEDPIEFVHHNIKCLMNQREVHTHTESFARALRAALREDPDIVLVGEMRDLETIAIAIETAETGHLVFGTLHTSSAPSTVDRIIDQFPSSQQAQIRVMLSEALKGVIAQTLLRTKEGKRVAAFEILLCPTSVSNIIREGKTFQLQSQMQIGKGIGMLTMNESIVNHVKSGRVDAMEGYVKAIDKVGLVQAYKANDIPIEGVSELRE